MDARYGAARRHAASFVRGAQKKVTRIRDAAAHPCERLAQHLRDAAVGSSRARCARCALATGATRRTPHRDQRRRRARASPCVNLVRPRSATADRNTLRGTRSSGARAGRWRAAAALSRRRRPRLHPRDAALWRRWRSPGTRSASRAAPDNHRCTRVPAGPGGISPGRPWLARRPIYTDNRDGRSAPHRVPARAQPRAERGVRRLRPAGVLLCRGVRARERGHAVRPTGRDVLRQPGAGRRARRGSRGR